MKIEIIDLWKDEFKNTMMLAKIPKEMEAPDLPKDTYKDEWEEYWMQMEEAVKVHLGKATLIQE